MRKFTHGSVLNIRITPKVERLLTGPNVLFPERPISRTTGFPMKTGTARYAQHYEIATYGESRVREGYAHWSGTFALGNLIATVILRLPHAFLAACIKARELSTTADSGSPISQFSSPNTKPERLTHR